jgi:hypothetical protein
MMWDHAAAQELLDALFAKAAELDEWDRQRALPVAFVRRARAVL